MMSDRSPFLQAVITYLYNSVVDGVQVVARSGITLANRPIKAKNNFPLIKNQTTFLLSMQKNRGHISLPITDIINYDTKNTA